MSNDLNDPYMSVKNSISDTFRELEDANNLVCMRPEAVIGIALLVSGAILLLLISLCCACCGWCCFRKRDREGVVIALPTQSTVMNTLHAYPPAEGYSRLQNEPQASFQYAGAETVEPPKY